MPFFQIRNSIGNFTQSVTPIDNWFHFSFRDERAKDSNAAEGAGIGAGIGGAAGLLAGVLVAFGILAALVLLGALNGLAALGAVFLLLLATATWPLDSGAIIDAIAGNAAAAGGNRLGDLALWQRR